MGVEYRYRKVAYSRSMVSPVGAETSDQPAMPKSLETIRRKTRQEPVVFSTTNRQR